MTARKRWTPPPATREPALYEVIRFGPGLSVRRAPNVYETIDGKRTLVSDDEGWDVHSPDDLPGEGHYRDYNLRDAVNHALSLCVGAGHAFRFAKGGAR